MSFLNALLSLAFPFQTIYADSADAAAMRTAQRTPAARKAPPPLRRFPPGNEGIERNPKYISRVFKEETQEGILDYMNRLRIKKARTLIKSGKFTLEQIGEMVGYASMKTFRRAFRKETRMTPAGYRDSLL